MAEILDSMPVPVGRPCKYPWDEWMDGQIRIIRRGEDYAITTTGMKAVLAHAATRYGKAVKIAKRDNTLTFRFDDAPS